MNVIDKHQLNIKYEELESSFNCSMRLIISIHKSKNDSSYNPFTDELNIKAGLFNNLPKNPESFSKTEIYNILIDTFRSALEQTNQKYQEFMLFKNPVNEFLLKNPIAKNYKSIDTKEYILRIKKGMLEYETNAGKITNAEANMQLSKLEQYIDEINMDEIPDDGLKIIPDPKDAIIK